MGTPRFWLVSTTQPEPKQRNAGWRGKGARGKAEGCARLKGKG